MLLSICRLQFNSAKLCRVLSAVFLVCLLLFATACLPPADEEVPKLINELRSPERNQRNKAALRLAEYGPEAEPATSALGALLKDPSGGVRSSAAYALRKIGSPQAERLLEAYQKKH